MRFRLLVPASLAALALAVPALAAAPQVTASAWLVQNGATGEVLARHNERAALPIASITKLMTVLVALRHADVEDVVTVSAGAVGVPGSSIGLRAGERVTVDDLVEAALVQSANDAATALGLHVGRGSMPRFAALMNA
ncbi:MAG: D-alanyl-D-alanine carboxypeptidase, partial [Actinobacteria bacterium]|nr:D-alanyl-D-alanine carboxypeptidase [Actinomycetota bacterium]